MSRNVNDLLADDDDDSSLVRDLRTALRESSKAQKALDAEVSTLRTSTRTTSLVTALQVKGVKAPAKVAKLVPSDIEATDEAIAAWLTEYADVLGVQTTEQTPPATEPADDGQPPPVDEGSQSLPFSPEQIAALRAMDITQGSALPPAVQQATAAKLADPNLTEAELLALIANPTAV